MNLLIALIALVLPGTKYIVPETSDPFYFPELRMLTLSDRVPEDVKVAFVGRDMRYCELAFGDSTNPKILIAVAEGKDGEGQLYIDRNRDKKIDEHDQCDVGSEWMVDLPTNDNPTGSRDARYLKVLFRYGQVTKTLRITTWGYMEGTVAVGGKQFPFRRIDGNANGQFADPADQLWIKCDDAKDWDAASHCFPIAPTLTLENQRFALKLDQQGQHATLEPIHAIGNLKLVSPSVANDAVIQRIQATYVSRDGVIVSFSDVDEVQQTPPGHYACINLALSLKQDGKIWTYVFYSPGEDYRKWEALQDSETVEIDPLGATRFTLALSTESVAPESIMRIQPQLWTESGLVIKTIFHGLEEPLYNGIEIAKLRIRRENQTIAQGTSGFACGTFCSVSIPIPRDVSAGPAEVSVNFDSGPLSGLLLSKAKFTIRK